MSIGGSKKLSTLVISLISVAVVIFVAIIIFLVWRFRAKLKGRMHIYFIMLIGRMLLFTILYLTSFNFISAVLPASASWLRSSEAPMLDAGRSKEFSTEMSGSLDPTVDGK